MSPMAGTFVFTHALRDFARVRRLLVWAIVAMVVYAIGASYGNVAASTTRMDTYILLSATLTYRILALSAAIFASAVVAQEVEGRTIVYLLTRPLPRATLLLGRMIAASLVVFIVSALSAFSLSLATVGLNNPVLRGDLVALAVGSLAYTGLFTLISLVINRAMIATLLFAFGWETLAQGIPGDLRLLTINNHLIAIAERPLPSNLNSSRGGALEAIANVFSSSTVSSSVAWLVLLGLIGVTFAGSMAWFSHFEYTAREDAE